MTQHQDHIVTTGIREVLRGALAIIITASLSSSFVMSSNTINGMGSGPLGPAMEVVAHSDVYRPL